MQILSLIPILILLSYLLFSVDLVYPVICESVALVFILSSIQIVLVLKLQVVSTLTNKWVVS